MPSTNLPDLKTSMALYNGDAFHVLPYLDHRVELVYTFLPGKMSPKFNIGIDIDRFWKEIQRINPATIVLESYVGTPMSKFLESSNSKEYGGFFTADLLGQESVGVREYLVFRQKAKGYIGRFIQSSRLYHTGAAPISLNKYIIDKFTKEGDVILDPFMGSGNIGIAAFELNRKYVGIEISEHLFNISERRICGHL